MATKQFAIPLDSASHQTGDRNFKELADAGTSAEFQLTNVSSASTTGELNLITKKGGTTSSHTFSSAIVNGKASVTLSASNLSTVYNDADGGDWDYVEAKWTVENFDTPNKSNMYMIQGGRTYNLVGWPPHA